MFDGDVSVYPFGNVIPNQQTMPEGKYPIKSESMFYEKTYPSGAFENPTPGKVDLELLNLLSVSLSKEENSPNNIIPAQPLGFMYDNILPPSGPSMNSTIFSDTPEIWDTVHQKDMAVDEVQEQASSNPFVNDLSAQEPRLYPVTSYEDLLPDIGNQSSPSTVSNSPVQNKASPWSDELQELFEKTFDFSDIDMDLILPPPSKRSPEIKNNISETNPSRTSFPVTVSNHTLQAATEALTTVIDKPSSNYSELTQEHPVVSKVKSEPVDHKPVSPVAVSQNPKAKSTILFGKHEDEIIHKLLVPNSGNSKKPVTQIELVSMPVENFNHLLELTDLDEIEVAFMKEWRRRGKNKTAAQIARKRKREEVGDLEAEVEEMRQQKVKLQARCDHLQSKIASLKERNLVAEKNVYEHCRQSYGKSLSRDTHLIHVTNENNIMLIPKISRQAIDVK